MKADSNILPRLVKQDKFGEEGNCLPACIASIFDLELCSIPNFCHLDSDYTWFENLNTWLSKRGLFYLEAIFKRNELDELFLNNKVIHIITGRSRRSTTLFHAVVALNGREIFDPHPSDLGLLETKTIRAGLFVKTFHSLGRC